MKTEAKALATIVAQGGVYRMPLGNVGDFRFVLMTLDAKGAVTRSLDPDTGRSVYTVASKA